MRRLGMVAVACALLAGLMAPRVSAADTALNPQDCVTDQLYASSPAMAGTVPVILVHGWTSSAGMWDSPIDDAIDMDVTPSGRSMIEQVNRIFGADAWYFDYHTYSARWVTDSHIGDALARGIECLSTAYGTKVVLVGHSMGGLAIRQALSLLDDPLASVAGVTTFGTPHEGSVAAMVLGTVTLPEDLAGFNAIAYANLIGDYLRFCGEATTIDLELCGPFPPLKAFDSEAGRALRAGSAELADLPGYPEGLAVQSLAGEVDIAFQGGFGLFYQDIEHVRVGDVIVTSGSAMALGDETHAGTCQLNLKAGRAISDDARQLLGIHYDDNDERAFLALFNNPCFHTRLTSGVELTNRAIGFINDQVEPQVVSVDEMVWRTIPVASPTSLDARMYGVTAWAGGLFATGHQRIGDNWVPAAWTSVDGDTWVPVEGAPPFGQAKMRISAVAPWGEGLTAVGSDHSGGDDDGAIWLSSDGRSWSRVSAADAVFGGAGDQVIKDVVAWNGGFVAVGSDGSGDDWDGAVWVSTDGRVWNRVHDDSGALGGSGNQAMMNVTVWDGGLVVTGRDWRTEFPGGAIWLSPDGQSWDRVPDPTNMWSDIDVGNAEWSPSTGFVLVGTEWKRGSSPEPVVYRSSDGRTWERSAWRDSLGGYVVMDRVRIIGSSFVALGADVGDCGHVVVWSSADGSNWTRLSVPSGGVCDGMSDVTYWRGMIVGVGAGAEVYEFDDPTVYSPVVWLADHDAATRLATLFSDYAILRSAPNLEPSSKITALSGMNGTTLTVLGPAVDGWYQVVIDGTQGWLFGTFVQPPDPGLVIARTLDGSPATLRSSSGTSLARDNPSGSKVLVVDMSASLWKVLLPDGTTAFVDPAELRTIP